jgi:hypothetical protein
VSRLEVELESIRLNARIDAASMLNLDSNPAGTSQIGDNETQ